LRGWRRRWRGSATSIDAGSSDKLQHPRKLGTVMVMRVSSVEPHWNYFLAIERDLAVLSRFVEFDERNFRCFSVEIARILLAAGAETDVVCKQVCKKSEGGVNADGINQYREVFRGKHPAIARFEVNVPRFGLTFQPWEHFRRQQGVPSWWTAYNKIKHKRNDFYHQASLRNALYAVGGLFVVNLYLHPEKARAGELTPGPELLRPGQPHFMGTTVGDFETGVNYLLD
jgi:hypothetical protein